VRRVRVRFSGNFDVTAEGDYLFPADIFPGTGSLAIDGTVVPYPPTTAVHLAAGEHRAELVSDYDPSANAPFHRLYWKGPDSENRQELLPFYRLGRERCQEGPESPAAGAASPTG
jgi:hypothetical protein